MSVTMFVQGPAASRVLRRSWQLVHLRTTVPCRQKWMQGGVRRQPSLREQDNIIDDTPIKYSSSPAKNYDSIATINSLTNYRSRTPGYQACSIFASIFAFVVYYMVFREDTKFDDKMARAVYGGLPHLHEHDLKWRIKVRKFWGKDTILESLQLEELKMISISRSISGGIRSTDFVCILHENVTISDEKAKIPNSQSLHMIRLESPVNKAKQKLAL